jgi:translation initiation factor IF-3
MPLSQALQIAEEGELDLVEVAPNVNPPVCRLLDYSKFKYEQAKKERQARKQQKAIELSQIRIRPRTCAHDVESKTNMAKKLLEKGNKVKILLIFKGREIVHPELGQELLENVAKALEGTAQVEKPPSLEGHHMSMILSPTKKVRGKS